MSTPTNLYQKLIMLMISSKRCIAGLCAPYDMTPVQGILLIGLDPAVGKSMSDLADQMGCDASNITGLIDHLEADKLIERTTDLKDRRVKLIRLTNKGEKRRYTLLEGLRTGQQIDLTKLTTNEQRTLGELIDKLMVTV